MEIMITSPKSKTIPCASLTCRGIVELTNTQIDEIKSCGFTVVKCECGKCFEVEFEKVVA
jgi:hypothetical protein